MVSLPLILTALIGATPVPAGSDRIGLVSTPCMEPPPASELMAPSGLDTPLGIVDRDAPVLALSLQPGNRFAALEPLHDPDAWIAGLASHHVWPIIRDSGRTLIRPFVPEPHDLWLWVPAGVLTGAALVWNVPLYHEIRYHWPDPVFADQRFSYWYSFLGEGTTAVGIFAGFGLVGLAGGEKEARVFREGLEALAAVAVFSRAAKFAFRLERPSADPNQLHWFSDNIWADAFPSGHAMVAFATAAVLAGEYPQLAPVFYALATYVGVARIQQATHWPADIVVGAAFGLAFGWAALRINHQFTVAPSVDVGTKGLALSGTF